jgi:hypothetical protein
MQMTKKSLIRVRLTKKGCDVVFADTPEGDLLVSLSANAARNLGEVLCIVHGLVGGTKES